MKTQEIKCELINLYEFMNALRGLGAVFMGSTKDIQYRIDDEKNTFESEGLYIRLRSCFSNTIALKERDINGHMNVVEVEVQNVDDILYIFKKIGLCKVRVMEKYRLEWILNSVTIDIDELPFGIYVEFKGNAKNVDEIRCVLKKYLGNESRKTYWEICDCLGTLVGQQNIVFEKEHKLKILVI